MTTIHSCPVCNERTWLPDNENLCPGCRVERSVMEYYEAMQEWPPQYQSPNPRAAHLLFVDGNTVTCVSREGLDLSELGPVEKRRASYIWPVNPVKQFCFRLLRCFFSERGLVAEWTRTWNGPWQVRFADEPKRVVFTHQSRRVCLAWEYQQLNRKLSNQ